MKKILLLTLPILSFSKPVKVDEILTEKNTYKVQLTTSYSNIQKSDGIIAPLEYQTNNGDFLTIPTYLGLSKINQDYLNYGITMRYGFNKDIEFFSSVNFYSLYTHYDSSENFLTQNDKGFNSLVLGAIYQVKHEDETPSLLFGTTVDVINKVSFSKLNEDKNVYFKGYTFFATSYYTVDPIVFLLQTTYRLNMENQYKQDSIEVADKFSLVPQLYFAANPYISINTGIRYSYQTKTKVNGKNIINSGSSLTYLLGVSYEINTKTILDISIDYSNSMGISQNNLSLGVIYKF